MDDIKTLRKKSLKALRKQLNEARARLHTMQFQLASNQLRDTSQLPKLRKTIARLLTVLQEKQKESAKS